MKPQIVIDGTVPGVLGSTTEIGSWSTSGSTGVVNTSADGVTATVAGSSGASYSPLIVEAEFAIKDGAGLFTNSGSADPASGVVFQVSYVGTSTLLTLSIPSATFATESAGNATKTEIACPFARDSVQTIRLSPGQRGWAVHYKSGSNWLKLMDIPVNDPTPYSDYLNSMSGFSVFGGVVATKNGLIFDKIKMYKIGLVWNNGPGTRILFSDHFVTAANGTPAAYNPASAAVPGDVDLVTLAGPPPSTDVNYLTFLEPKYASPGVTIVSADRLMPNGIATADHPFQMIRLDFHSGQGAIKLVIAGIMKNVYFNSDIATPGTFHAITVESGAS